MQALAGDFLHLGRQDLAVLATRPDNTSQVLVFPNNGNGTFASPIISDVGEGATGFSFLPASAGQPDRLVVGNAYGDFLILLGDGAGHFVVDRSGLSGKPLAVLQRKDAPPLVVLADEQTGQVQVFVQSGTNQSGSSPFTPLASLSVPSSGLTQAPPAPGGILLTDLNGDGIPDLVVADRLGNDVLVFQGQANGTFDSTPSSISVGFEPDAIAVGKFNSDGITDLAVANQGSNDVSILNGALDASGQWTGTHGPRLSSGGSEPLAVVAGDFNHDGIADIRATNAGGQIATILGIGTPAPVPGTAGQGTGFFNDTNLLPPNLGSTVLQAAFDASTGNEFLVLVGGLLVSFNGASFTPIGSGVAAVAAADGILAAGLDTGGVEVIDESSGLLGLQSPEFTDLPSALEALRNGAEEIDVYVSYKGKEVPFFYSFTFPVITDLPQTVTVAEATPLAGPEAASLTQANLLVVAVLLRGGLSERPLGQIAPTFAMDASFSVFGKQGQPAGRQAAEKIAGDADQEDEEPPADPSPKGGPAGPVLPAYQLGVEEGMSWLLQSLRSQQPAEVVPPRLRRTLPSWWDQPPRRLPEPPVLPRPQGKPNVQELQPEAPLPDQPEPAAEEGEASEQMELFSHLEFLPHSIDDRGWDRMAGVPEPGREERVPLLECGVSALAAIWWLRVPEPRRSGSQTTAPPRQPGQGRQTTSCAPA